MYYSKTILNRFLRPKHLGHFSAPDGVGDTQNLKCGDIMKIYIKVANQKGKEYIKDVKFETLGCGAAIAVSDMICELAKGKTLAETKKISFQDVAGKLGAMPPQKMHCAHLAETALRSAIKDYEKSSLTRR